MRTYGPREPRRASAEAVDVWRARESDRRLCVHGRLHHLLAQREGDRLRPAVDAELQQDVLDVLVDRLRAQEQSARDACRVEAASEEAEDLALARRQFRRRGGRHGGAPLETMRPRDELVERERLHEVVVRAEEQPGDAVDGLGPLAGDENDADGVAELLA